MSDRLSQDLVRLQRDHAIDDSLIESLRTSREQAREHIRIWHFMMWLTNGGLAAGLSLLFGFAAYAVVTHGAVWGWIAGPVAFTGLFLIIRTFLGQRRAYQAILDTARQHDLV